MIPRSWLIGGLLAALVASNSFSLMRGKAWGERVCEARYAVARAKTQADLIREADRLALRAVELQQIEADLTARAQEAEDAARADFDPCRIPSDRSLQRLQTRWQRAGNP